MFMINGILLIDKPEGFTSFDVIAKLRGMAKTKKLGHAGTLDPMATGVLPVFFGRATKAIDLLPNHDKGYIASMRLGITTDTQDITGQILCEKPHDITDRQLREALPAFTGEIEQLPPMYSAVRVGGRRLYDIARSGGEVERKPRKISIYELALLDIDEQTGNYRLFVKCSRGTYIRTLCHDLGEALGCGAVMTRLRRVAACGFTIDDCVTLEQVQALCREGKLEAFLRPVESAFAGLPRLILSEAQAARFLNGVALWLEQFEEKLPPGPLCVLDEAGRFLGLATAGEAERQLKIIKLFLLE